MGCSIELMEKYGMERKEKKDRAEELIKLNESLINKAKSAPLFAKAAVVEQLADNQQELSKLLLDLII